MRAQRGASRRNVLAGAAGALGGGVVGLSLGTPGGSSALGAGRALAQETSAPASTPTPDMQAILDAFAALGPLPLEELSPRQARELPSFADAVQGVRAARGQAPAAEPVGAVTHAVIPGGPGSEGTLVRVYVPAAPAPGREGAPYPVLVYFHGGGWVIANLNVYDASARALANAAGAMVVSVAYRQAPEAPFPAAVEDAYAAYAWVKGNAASLGGDPQRVAVGGESAGGNLATVTALLAQARGTPRPAHQLLVYPVTDLANDYPSYGEYAAAKPLSTPALKWFGRYYLPEGTDPRDTRASPLLASPNELRGLPPATVITAEIDPLRDQGLAYAGRLREAGVAVTARHYERVTHEFFGAAAVLPEASDAVSLAASGLRAAFAQA